MTILTAFTYTIQKIFYNSLNRVMVYWQGKDSYLNNELIQISDVDIMIDLYGSSGSFGSRVRSKYIGNNTYTVRRGNFC